MWLSPSRARCNRYIPTVGRAFLVELLYGCKHSLHLGACHSPPLYLKALLLLCGGARRASEAQRRHLRCMIAALLPVGTSQDHLLQEKMLQCLDTTPLDDDADAATVSSTTTTMMTATADTDTTTSSQASSSSQSTSTATTTAATSSSDTPCLAAVTNSSDAAMTVDHMAYFLSAVAFPARVARVLVYDAVQLCLVTGAPDALQRQYIVAMATHSGLSSVVRERIEQLAHKERALAERKRQLLLLPPPPTSSSTATTTTTTTTTLSSSPLRPTPPLSWSSRGAYGDGHGRVSAVDTCRRDDCHGSDRNAHDAKDVELSVTQTTTTTTMQRGGVSARGVVTADKALTLAQAKAILRRAHAQGTLPHASSLRDK